MTKHLPGYIAGFKAGHVSAMTTMERIDIERLRFISDLIKQQDELVALVRAAHDRFTDKDMIPHNHALAQWSRKALMTLEKCSNRQNLQQSPPRTLTQEEVDALMANMRVVEKPSHPRQTH